MKKAVKTIAYSLLRIATGNKGVKRTINGFKVRFPARWSRYYENNYEAVNYNFLSQQVKPGMHIIDIGAHLGLFSACASQLTGPQGKIICIEPTPGTFSILEKTIELNHCTNVTAVQAAVSDKEGMATFYVSHTAGCNSNSLVKNKAENDLSFYDVRLVTIDSLVQQYALHPSLIKIDVEGAELDTLKGGLHTLATFKPVLILGLHPAFINQKGDSLEAIWDLLQSNRYEVKAEGKRMTREDFCSADLLFDVHCFSL